MKFSKTRAGFTLIEVMIAMTLISIMMVLLVSSLKTSAESWEIGERKITEVNENAMVYHFFRRHLSSAKPLSNHFAQNQPAFSFQGTNRSLQFVSSFPASASRKGLQLFEIKLSDKDSGSIKVSLSPYFPALDNEARQTEEVVLIEDVAALKISYFSRTAEDVAGQWTESWQEKPFLPELVKIKIELKNERFWPEFIIPLKINSAIINEADKVFDLEAFEEEQPLEIEPDDFFK